MWKRRLEKGWEMFLEDAESCLQGVLAAGFFSQLLGCVLRKKEPLTFTQFDLPVVWWFILAFPGFVLVEREIGTEPGLLEGSGFP